MHPIVAPANQLAITTPLHPWENIPPSAYYFQHSERAWYEFIAARFGKPIKPSEPSAV